MSQYTRNANRIRPIIQAFFALTFGLFAISGAAEATTANEEANMAPDAAVWYLEIVLEEDLDNDGFIGPPPIGNL